MSVLLDRTKYSDTDFKDDDLDAQIKIFDDLIYGSMT